MCRVNKMLVIIEMLLVFDANGRVDKWFGVIIIIFTRQLACGHRAPHDQETKPRSQVPGSPARGLLASPSRASHRRSARFRPPGTAARFVPTSGSSGFASPTKVWHHGSSTQPRTRIDAQSKKTAVNEDLPHSIPQQEWMARYEQLRSDALSRGQGISTGFGLTLFLRHGMVAWMRACSRAVTPPGWELAQPSPISSLPCDVRAPPLLTL